MHVNFDLAWNRVCEHSQLDRKNLDMHASRNHGNKECSTHACFAIYSIWYHVLYAGRIDYK